MTSSLFSGKPPVGREMQHLAVPGVTALHTGSIPPLSPRVRSRLYVDTASSQGGGLSPTQQLLQRLSPQQQAAAATVGLIQSTSQQRQAPAPPGVVYQASPQHQVVSSSPVIQSHPSPVQAVQVAPPPSTPHKVRTPSMVMTPPDIQHVHTASLPASTPAAAPTPMRDSSPRIGTTINLSNGAQSKSFRSLQINFSDGGKMEIPIRVDHHFGSPSPQQQGQNSRSSQQARHNTNFPIPTCSFQS